MKMASISMDLGISFSWDEHYGDYLDLSEKTVDAPWVSPEPIWSGIIQEPTREVSALWGVLREQEHSIAIELIGYLGAQTPPARKAFLPSMGIEGFYFSGEYHRNLNLYRRNNVLPKIETTWA